MALYRQIYAEFWRDAKVIEEMTPDDKLFYLYLLTNPNTTQIGIYGITKKQMAFELGYSLETVNTLFKRFENELGLIEYDSETREICLINWGKYNFPRAGKPIEDCVKKELKAVKNTDFIKIIYQKIENEKIKAVFQNFLAELYESRDVVRDVGRDVIRDGGNNNNNNNKNNNNNNNNNNNKADEIRLLKKSFDEISDEDIEKILGVLEQKREGISYLREKIEVVQNTDNVKSVVGYLIKAILDDYKKFEKKGSSSRNKFKNFYEPVAECTKEELEEKIRQSQSKKFG